MLSIDRTLTINQDRLKADLEALASIGATPQGGVTRLALSNEDLEARAWFADRIEEANLLIHDDAVGNLSGILPCANQHARTLLIGSHLDTVPNGGLYDGTLGVLAALECLRTLGEAQTELPFHVEAINFTDEEGTWQSFFGSLGLIGGLRASHLNDSEVDNSAFRVALFRAGIHPIEVLMAQRDPETLLGFLELHIEQGEMLHRTGTQIGIVTAVVGRKAYDITFLGEASHAATTAREKQRDALRGAAKFVTAIHEMNETDYPTGVVNCGNVQVKPGIYNVIPSEALLRVECRHPDENTLDEMETRMLELAQRCAAEYRLVLQTRTVLRRPVAVMDEMLRNTIRAVCAESKLSHMPLISYAGHDAQILSRITPSAMIFVPSVDGISHNPREETPWNDVVNGANVLLHTILRLATP